MPFKDAIESAEYASFKLSLGQVSDECCIA